MPLSRIITSRRAIVRALGSSVVLIGCKQKSGVSASVSASEQAVPTWASGGTAAMTAKDSYPDPFAGALTGACAVLCETTEGPCTADTKDRKDISEDMPGLPVRLSLMLVRGDACEPLSDALVEVWHTQKSGVYSGVTPSGSFCYGDDPSAEKHLYFRGSQKTDARGRVDFDTCYPGWYRGRAVHIHVRVRLGESNILTTQLFFDELLTAEVFGNHREYVARGLPDTTHDSDNIIGGTEDKSPYILDVQSLQDNVMLASKVLAVPASADTPTCRAEGNRGGGPGGPGRRGEGAPPGKPNGAKPRGRNDARQGGGAQPPSIGPQTR